MVAAAARELKNAEVVVVGIGLPMIACMLAKSTHAPDLTPLLEIGVADMHAVDTPVGLADPRIYYRATCLSGFLDTLGMSLHRGVVDVGFLGGLEVDSFGNSNTSLVKGLDGRVRWMNGSAGANDVASHAKRVIIVLRHGKRKLPQVVSHLTSPGFPYGKSRQELGMRGGGPHRIITDMAILGFNAETRQPELLSVHPGLTVQQVVENTGFKLRVPEEVPTTALPTNEELRLLREEIDPQRMFLKDKGGE
jgi:acyl CoA:acetate/3-ketoacid CoA transferase beta subunit